MLEVIKTAWQLWLDDHALGYDKCPIKGILP